MDLTDEQKVFVQQIAHRIPRLLAAIRQGNVKSEFIVGLKRIDNREVRLKLVAEVVDAGANPLQTHGCQHHDGHTGTQTASAASLSGQQTDQRTGQNTGQNTPPSNGRKEIHNDAPAYTPATARRRPRKRS